MTTKKDEQTQEVKEPQQAQPAASAIEWPVTLTAPTREELMQKLAELKAQNDGAILSTGAVGRVYETGTYMLMVDIIPNNNK